MGIKTLLDAEIQDEFSQLAKMEVGSESYRNAVDGLTKLVDRAIELKKFEAERDEKMEAHESDQTLKLRQMREDHRGRIARNCIDVGIALLGVCVTVWGTRATFKFEEEGTISTTIGRGFINKLIPKK